MSKTLILSDIHFCKNGSSVRSFDSLRSLWQGFDDLILNGDTAETLSSTLAEKSIQLTESLVDAARAEGVHVTLLGGNHDPDISDLDHVYLSQEKILVFHGHAAFQDIAPWSWRSPHILRTRSEYISLQGDGFAQQLEAVRNAASKVRTQEFNKFKPTPIQMMMLAVPSLLNVLRGWCIFPSLVSRWVETYSPQSSFVVTGHSHHAGIWKRSDRTIINTGCFGLRGFPSRPRAVVIDDQQLRVFKLRKSNGVYEFGNQVASFEVK